MPPAYAISYVPIADSGPVTKMANLMLPHTKAEIAGFACTKVSTMAEYCWTLSRIPLVRWAQILLLRLESFSLTSSVREITSATVGAPTALS